MLPQLRSSAALHSMQGAYGRACCCRYSRDPPGKQILELSRRNRNDQLSQQILTQVRLSAAHSLYQK